MEHHDEYFNNTIIDSRKRSWTLFEWELNERYDHVAFVNETFDTLEMQRTFVGVRKDVLDGHGSAQWLGKKHSLSPYMVRKMLRIIYQRDHEHFQNLESNFPFIASKQAA